MVTKKEPTQNGTIGGGALTSLRKLTLGIGEERVRKPQQHLG